VRVARFAREGKSLEAIGLRVAESLGIGLDEMLKKGARGAASDARKATAWIAHREWEIPVSLIARFLGVSGSAVSMMLPTGSCLLKKHDIAID
jgi:hypothetical protein